MADFFDFDTNNLYLEMKSLLLKLKSLEEKLSRKNSVQIESVDKHFVQSFSKFVDFLQSFLLRYYSLIFSTVFSEPKIMLVKESTKLGDSTI
jgi:hypothetical protein